MVTEQCEARFPFKHNRLSCVNENRKCVGKRLRLNGNRAWVTLGSSVRYHTLTWCVPGVGTSSAWLRHSDRVESDLSIFYDDCWRNGIAWNGTVDTSRVGRSRCKQTETECFRALYWAVAFCPSQFMSRTKSQRKLKFGEKWAEIITFDLWFRVVSRCSDKRSRSSQSLRTYHRNWCWSFNEPWIAIMWTWTLAWVTDSL